MGARAIGITHCLYAIVGSEVFAFNLHYLVFSAVGVHERNWKWSDGIMAAALGATFCDGTGETSISTGSETFSVLPSVTHT